MASRERTNLPLTIANAATVSNAIDARGMASGSFIIITALTGTVTSFQGSVDGATWVDLYTAANAATGVAVIAADKAYPIPAQVFDWPYFRLSGLSSQGAARTGTVSMNG